MGRTLISRAGILLALVAVLAAMGVLRLPWGDPVFQVSGATVLVYMIWSVLAGARCACSGRSPARLCLYAVLLVSAVDSFLLRLTVVDGLIPLRWAGTALLAAGCTFGLLPRRSSSRYAPAMQLIGLAIGLGSAAGAACAVLASVIALKSPECAAPGDDQG
jgi:hypothetical protein